MKNIIVTISLIVFSLSLSAQSVEPMISIPSPNAMNLGIYGEIPVSFHTGIPNISIPLYTIKEGSLEVPVSISYHADGVRPDVHPGWVGMGWSLNAGGMITRKVKGLPDEYCLQKRIVADDSEGSNFCDYDYHGYFYNYPILNNNKWYEQDTIWKYAALKWNERFIGRDPGIDTEPDEYIFNFNGYTGKFLISEKGKIVVVSEPGIKVEVEPVIFDIHIPEYVVRSYTLGIDASIGSYVRNLAGFRITTPDGVKYDFGYWNSVPEFRQDNNLRLEASLNFFGQIYTEEVYDTWYLVKITSPNNQDEIEFTYEQGDPVVSFGKITAYEKMEGHTEPHGIWKLFGPLTSSSMSFNTHYHGRIIMPTYLKQITTGNEEIIFSTSHTTELKYDYVSILFELASIAGEAFSNYSYSNYTSGSSNSCGLTTAGTVYFDRWVGQSGSAGGNPSVNLGTYYSPRSIVSGYYSSDPCNDENILYLNAHSIVAMMLEGNLGVFLRPDLTYNCGGVGINDYECIDFNAFKWKQLDNIEIKKKGSSSFTKKIDFGYSHNENERLRLLSMQVTGTNNKTIPPYTFEYEDYESNKYTASDVKLPPYNSSLLDHWGFFNNRNSFPTSYETSYLRDYKDLKDPDPDYLYAGILNKINYPTGGFTEFTYEPHKYSKVVTRNESTGEFSVPYVGIKTAGGLRIKEIRNYPGNSLPFVVKTYKYDPGILNGEIQYFWEGYQGRVMESNNPYTSDRFVNQSLLPVSSNSGGSHISYSKVTEEMNGNGRTEYFFTNHSDINGHTEAIDENFVSTVDIVKSPYSPFNSKVIERGKLKEKKVFNEDGDLVQDEVYLYEKNTNAEDQYVKALEINLVPVMGATGLEGTAYKVYTYPYNLSQKTVTVYDHEGNNPVTTVTDLDYNSKNLVKTGSTTESDGSTISTHSLYPFDYSRPNQVFLQEMKTANIVSAPIETYTTRNNYATNGTIITYNSGNNLGLPDKIYKMNQVDNFSYPNPSNTDGYFNINSTYEPSVHFDSYEDGRIAQLHKEEDENMAYIWGYNNSFPIIKAENSDITTLTNCATEASGGELNTLKEFVMNIDYSDDAWKETWKLFNATLRADVRLANSLVTTYTYNPLFGMTSMTDPGGISTYYEYDDLGRLWLVKDNDGSIIKEYQYEYTENTD